MKNRTARQLLEMIYGKDCMFQRGKIAQKIEEIGGITTYKQFVTSKKYRLKKIKTLESRLTYHHLKHKSDGGETSVMNGAVVNELAHRYIHSLPREQEEVVNDLIRHYKDTVQIKGMFIESDLRGTISIDSPYIIDFDENDFYTIPLFETGNDYDTRVYNRAKIKRETQQIIYEELGDIDDELEII